MFKQADCKLVLTLTGEKRRIPHQVIRPNPIDGSYRNLHSEPPVHAVIDGIAVSPRIELIKKLLAILLITTPEVSFSQRDGVMKTTQVPGHLDVGRITEVDFRQIFKVE